jgi:hypothetical protein
MVASQRLVAESLAALVADQGLGFLARLESCNLRLGLVFIAFFILALLSSLDVLEGLVLVVLEPLKGALHYKAVSRRASARLGTLTAARSLDSNLGTLLVEAHVEELVQIRWHLGGCAARLLTYGGVKVVDEGELVR